VQLRTSWRSTDYVEDLMSESPLRTPDESAPAGETELASDLIAAYSELQSLVLDNPDLDRFFQQVANLAGALADNSPCGIMLRRDRQVTTVAVNDGLAGQLDELQYGHGQGPCLQCLHTGEKILVSDLATDDRWGGYRLHALTYGVRSSASFPLTVKGETLGALNFYATEPEAFSPGDLQRNEAFAGQVATTLMLVLQRADQVALEGQLRSALATREVVDQAIGILMGQQGLDAAAAFALLREASQARNRKLADIAADLIKTVTGSPPRPPRPFIEPR
jgi:GAF domain-containing protein